MEQPFSQNCHLLKLEVDIIEKIIARNRNQHHTTDVFVLFRKIYRGIGLCQPLLMLDLEKGIECALKYHSLKPSSLGITENVKVLADCAKTIEMSCNITKDCTKIGRLLFYGILQKNFVPLYSVMLSSSSRVLSCYSSILNVLYNKYLAILNYLDKISSFYENFHSLITNGKHEIRSFECHCSKNCASMICESNIAWMNNLSNALKSSACPEKMPSSDEFHSRVFGQVNRSRKVNKYARKKNNIKTKIDNETVDTTKVKDDGQVLQNYDDGDDLGVLLVQHHDTNLNSLTLAPSSVFAPSTMVSDVQQSESERNFMFQDRNIPTSSPDGKSSKLLIDDIFLDEDSSMMLVDDKKRKIEATLSIDDEKLFKQRSSLKKSKKRSADPSSAIRSIKKGNENPNKVETLDDIDSIFGSF